MASELFELISSYFWSSQMLRVPKVLWTDLHSYYPIDWLISMKPLKSTHFLPISSKHNPSHYYIFYQLPWKSHELRASFHAPIYLYTVVRTIIYSYQAAWQIKDDFWIHGHYSRRQWVPIFSVGMASVRRQHVNSVCDGHSCVLTIFTHI